MTDEKPIFKTEKRFHQIHSKQITEALLALVAKSGYETADHLLSDWKVSAVLGVKEGKLTYKRLELEGRRK